MANAQIGANHTPNDFIFDATMHQCWLGVFTPSDYGRMIQVDAYCAAAASGGTGGAVGWLNINSAPLQTTTDSMAVGSGTSGVWHTTTGDVPFNNTDSWWFGFYASKGVWVIYWDGNAGGDGQSAVKASAISPVTGGTLLSAYNGRNGSILAYGTYFIIEVYQRVSGAWVKKFVTVRRGGVNGTSYPTYVRRGGGWTQVAFQEIPFDNKPVPIRFQDGTDGLVVFEGPFYLGSTRAREMQLYPRRFEDQQKQKKLVLTEAASQVIKTVREALKPKVWVPA